MLSGRRNRELCHVGLRCDVDSCDVRAITPVAIDATVDNAAINHATRFDRIDHFGAGAVTAASPNTAAVGSSRAIRASPMSRRRRLTSRSRHRDTRRRTAGGVDAGSPVVDGLTQHRRERVRDVLALECALTRQHFVENRAERPHVAALVSWPSLHLLRTQIRGGAEDHPDLGQRWTGDRR